MKAFISALLGYDAKQKNLDGGILGVVKAYYGCVEAQGRGTLHCHMLVWVEGGLNPNEIKKRALSPDAADVEFSKRLLAFLDDTISNAIPPDPDPNLQDMHNLASKCQSHEHSKTCFKYWRGPPDPKTCRFDLHEDNFKPTSSFDAETGEICLRCLDGLVNNFNATVLEAMRCNMDIKFIGSGASAKGILYYITDYITKSQLKTHVAFAMLELAVKKLGEFNPREDDISVRAKKMLQKCAYAMISQQELSAQQVASYLMDFEDHFTSHTYRNLYWTAFENFINKELKSPECYPSKNDDSSFLNDLAEPQNAVDVGDDDREIRVGFDGTGNLVSMGSQLADYQRRGDELSNTSVWDFISQVDKVKKSTDRRSHKSGDEQTPENDFQEEELVGDQLLDDAAAEEPEGNLNDGSLLA
ncbi:hypothetical protein GGX14DRAFT_372312 [Mycena pura]|uniref:Helitron helicase-like domain-containing protein n=1 Tax=Mycena pura TaxID=153505 RepID=A0AAD6V5G4_9AGAR|nr:hypothetical protein GGX14DRAFT_372312 [Mycena pura]